MGLHSVTMVPCFHDALLCQNAFLGSMGLHNDTLAPWFHEATECHKGLHYSIRSCCVTMVSIIQRGPVLSQRSPWFHSVRTAPLSHGAPHCHCVDSMRNSCCATMAAMATMVSSETLYNHLNRGCSQVGGGLLSQESTAEWENTVL